MDDRQPLNRAERRRRSRTEQKTRQRADHPRHGPDPEAVLIQLMGQASQLGVAELVSLTDLDLDMLPDGSIEFARGVFAPNFSVDLNMHQLVRLVAVACELWADLQHDPDEAEASMLQRCGLARTVGTDQRRIEVEDTTLFSKTSMLVVNRIALVGESTPPHR